jgi:hypothetical protein
MILSICFGLPVMNSLIDPCMWEPWHSLQTKWCSAPKLSWLHVLDLPIMDELINNKFHSSWTRTREKEKIPNSFATEFRITIEVGTMESVNWLARD